MNYKFTYILIVCLVIFAGCVEKDGDSFDADDSINDAGPTSIATSTSYATSTTLSSAPDTSDTLSVAPTTTLSDPADAGDEGISFSETPLEFDDVLVSLKVNDKLAYVGSRNNKSTLVYDGRMLGAGYDSVLGFVGRDDDIAFLAMKSGRTVIVYDGEEYGDKYQFIGAFTLVGGELIYLASRDGADLDVLVRGGEEIETGYDILTDIRDFGMTYGYTALKDGKSYIIYDGNEIAGGLDEAYLLREPAEKLNFMASKAGATYVYSDGVETASPEGFPDYDSFILVGGKPAYRLLRDNRQVIVLGEEILSPVSQYDYLGSLMTEVDGKLAYTAVLNTMDYVVFDGIKVGINESYDSIDHIGDLNGKLSYIASRDSKKYIVYDDILIGDGFEDVKPPQYIDAKITYIAKREGEWYLYVEGQE